MIGKREALKNHYLRDICTAHVATCDDPIVSIPVTWYASRGLSLKTLFDLFGSPSPARPVLALRILARLIQFRSVDPMQANADATHIPCVGIHDVNTPFDPIR